MTILELANNTANTISALSINVNTAKLFAAQRLLFAAEEALAAALRDVNGESRGEDIYTDRFAPEFYALRNEIAKVTANAISDNLSKQNLENI